MKKYIFAFIIIILGWVLILSSMFGDINKSNKNNALNTKYVIDEDIKIIDICNAFGSISIKRGEENIIEIPKNLVYEIKDNALYIKYNESYPSRKLRKNEINVFITYKNDVDIKIKNFAGIINADLPYGKHYISNVAGIAHLYVLDDIYFESFETFAKSDLKVENNKNSKTSLKILTSVGKYKINRK